MLTLSLPCLFFRISVRYEEDRDLVYVRFRWFLRQELSLEVEELDEDLVIDVRGQLIPNLHTRLYLTDPFF